MLVGLLLIGLFVLSDVAQSPTCGFLPPGAVLLGLGLYLWFRDPTPSQPTERFRVIKGMQKKPGDRK